MARIVPRLIDQFTGFLGADGVLSDALDLSGFATDWRLRYNGRTDAVLLPRCTADVAKIIRICSENDVAIIPQGGNTGQSGGSVPLSDQGINVIVNLSRMNRIRAVDRDNNTMTVDAGVVLQTVQATAEANGRFFPLSLGAEAPARSGKPVDECRRHECAEVWQCARVGDWPGGGAAGRRNLGRAENASQGQHRL